jgi:O-antigen ligase
MKHGYGLSKSVKTVHPAYSEPVASAAIASRAKPGSNASLSTEGRAGGKLSRALGAIIFYTLLALLLLVSIPYGTVEPWWEALFECVVFALGALWVIEGMLSRGWITKEHRIFLPVLALALYALLQTLPGLAGNSSIAGLKVWNAISADPYQTRLFVLKLLAFTLSGVMLLRYTSSSLRLRALVYTLIGVGLLSALFGIVRQTTQHSTGFFLPFLHAGSGYGQFINRNHFAFLMEMVLGLTLGLIVAGGVRREQILVYLSLVLPVWVALVLCNSRGGLFSMLAEVLFLALLFSFRRAAGKNEPEESKRGSLWWSVAQSRIVRPILVAGLVAVVFIGALWIGGEALTSRLETVSSEVSAESGAGNEGARRLEVWRATWALIKDRPLMGVGFNGYWAAIPLYHNASGELTPQQAHNDYLELVASGGLIGLLLVLWFMVLLVKSIRRSFQSTDAFRRAASMGASVGLFGVAIHSMVDFGLHITINALVLTALVVIAVADCKVEAQDRAEKHGDGIDGIDGISRMKRGI